MTDPRARPLRRRDLDPDPLRQFLRWQAGAGSELVALATATGSGAPSLRMVLLKGADEQGFLFFSSYASRKGRELAENPRAALLFHWQPLGRQVRVEGPVSRVDRAEGEAYARSRPRQSQLSALASPQSQVVPDREWLERRVAELEREYESRELPVGEHWGGYRVEPESWEFWQHDENRLHDRERYTRVTDGWRVERLAP